MLAAATAGLADFGLVAELRNAWVWLRDMLRQTGQLRLDDERALEAFLEQGAARCVFLLDGLNEVAPLHRDRLVDEIVRWLVSHPRHAAILTSRAQDELWRRLRDAVAEAVVVQPITDAQRCNFNGNVKTTTPVGQYSPQGDSPYGCADMAGNVWEWTRSHWKGYPYRAEDGREALDTGESTPRVVRGGRSAVLRGTSAALIATSGARTSVTSFWVFGWCCPYRSDLCPSGL